MDMRKSKKNIKFTTIAWVMGVMLLVIIIPINILVSVFDFKLDLTENNLYSLTDTTKNYLSSLDKKVDLYLLTDMDELRKYKEAMAFTNILDEYSSYDCINFKAVDPNTHPEVRNELNLDEYMKISEGDILVRCGENIKKIPFDPLYTYDYDENGNAIAENFKGENYITGAIKAVVEGVMPSVYFLTGHGEKTIENNYKSFHERLESNNYKAKELNLTTMDAVPEDAAIIIVAAPKKDITSAEKAKIEKFMDKGGNLSLLMSPNADDIDYTNIEDIMHQYCIGMDYNIVHESDSSRHVSGDQNQIMVNLVDVSQSEDKNIVDLTSDIINVTTANSYIPYMPASRTFYEYQGQARSDLTICPLIETYDTAVAAPCGGRTAKSEDMAGLLYLAAYSEDRIRNNSKLFVMGNAEFIDDKNTQESYFIVPALLYLSSITWMYNNDVDMNISDKKDKSDYMTLESQEDTNAMMIILNTAPAIVALSGIFIWLKRRHA